MTFLLVFMMLLGCKGPKGGSSVEVGHDIGLPAPGTFSFSKVRATSTSVNLYWTKSSRVTSYSLSYGLSPGSITTPLPGCDGLYTSCVVSNLVDGTTYYFSVSASNSAGSTGISSVAEAMPLGDFDLTTEADGDHQVEIAWNTAAFATSYEIRYGTSSGYYPNSVATVAAPPYTITGLSNGFTYFFQVIAKNAKAGYNPSTNELTGTPVGLPDVPNGLAVTVTGTGLQLNWSAVTGASSYRVYRGTTLGSLSLYSSGLLTNSFLDTSATAGTTYYYYVKSFTTVESPASSTVAGKSISSFSLNSISTGGVSNQLVVDWGAATGADSFDLLVGTASGFYTTRISGVSSPYTASSLTPGTSYYFRVEARNAIGAGGSRQSLNELSGSPVAAVGSPATPALTATSGQVNLNWASVPGASSYQVLRGLSAGSLSLLADTVVSTSYSDTTVSDGTTYYYALRSFNGTLSPASGSASIRSMSNFSISSAAPASSTSIAVSWGASTGAQAYDLYLGTSSGALSLSSSNITSPFVVTGLTQGTNYFLSIRGRNALSTPVSVSTGETSARTFPSTPTGLTVAGTPGTATLNWTAVSGVSAYQIFRGTSSGSYSQIESNATTNTYVDNTTADGTTYYYAIKATNVNQSPYSSEVSIRTIQDFATTSLTSTTATGLQVSWPAVAGAANFDLVYGTSVGSLTSTASNVTSPYSLTGLSANTTYYVAIKAKNAVGPGTTRQTATVNVKTLTPALTSLAATTQPDQIRLTWGAVSGATSYNVFRGTSSGSYSQIASGVMSTNFTDNSVANGTTYFYVVRSFNGSESGDSNEVQARSIESFSISSLTVNSASTATLTWPAVAGASSYDVAFGTSVGSHGSVLTSVTSPYVVSGLSANTTYYFVVRAKNAVGAGTQYESPETSALTAFGAPSTLLAQGKIDQVDLTWNAVAGASSYKVFRGTSSGSYVEIASSVPTNTYSDTSVANGTTYFYVVRSFNGSSSANSNESSARSLSSFTLSLAVVNSTSLTASWGAVTGASSYTISYGTASGSYTTTLPGVTSPYSLTGLTPGNTYYVIVTALNAVGGGGTSVSPEAGAATAFSPPAGLSASATPGTAALTWNTVTGASSYKVFRGTTSGSYVEIANSLGTNSFSDSGLSNGTTYYYVVRAYNGTDSANSSEVSIRPVAAVASTTLTTTSSTSLTLTWPAVSGASTYDIIYGTTSGSLNLTLSNVTSPAVISSLAANTTYYVQLRAKNAVGSGTSVLSTEQSSITLTATPSVSLTTQPGEIDLSWTAISGASSYKIYRGTSVGTISLLTTGVTGTSYADTTVANGTAYYYYIRAFNGSDSANSNTVSGKSIQSFSITSVIPLDAARLQVTFPATAGGDSFDVAWGTVSGTYPSVQTGVTSPYTITGLNPGTVYFVVVRARNVVGVSSLYQSGPVSVPTPLNPPSGLTATATPGQIALSWGAVSGATGYNILKSTTSGATSLFVSNNATTTYTDTSVANGTPYYYTVQTLNGSTSLKSSEVAAKSIASFSISSVAVTTSTSVTVNFPASAGADTFDIAYGTTSGSYGTVLTSVTSPRLITGLSPGTTYYFVVRGQNAIGTGTTFQTPQVSALTSTGAPATLSLVPTPGSVALSWGTVSGASTYNVYRGTVSGSLTLLTSGIATNTATDATVVNGTTYFYAVTASNGTESVKSIERSVSTISAFSTTALTMINSTTLRATWPTVSGAATYNLSYGTSSGSYSTTLTNVTSPYNIGGLAAGTTYFVRVIATNAVGVTASVTSTNELSAQTNSLPIINTIAPQSMPTDTNQAFNFTISDANNALTCAGSVSVTSSNTALIPNSGVVITGTAPNCIATMTPLAAQTGTSTLTLTVSDTIESVFRTVALTVTPCTVASIVWETQPVGMVAGSTFATAPRISLRQANNSLCTTDLTPVQIQVNDDFSVQQDAEITAGDTGVPSGGYVTFSTARMTRAGANFTLIAGQNAATSIESNAYTVTANTAVGIAFSVQPGPTDRSAIMLPSPVVRSVDTYGNYKNPASTFSVTISLINNAVGAVMAGTVTRTTNSSGIATFSGLTIDKESTFSMRATGVGYGTVDSTPFDVAPLIPQTHVTLMELIQGPLNHPTGAVTYNRTGMTFGTVNIDGTISYNFEIVAKNSSGAAVSVRLRRGSTNIALITIPATDSTTNYYTTSFSSALVNTTNSTYTIQVTGATTNIYSARVVAKQTSAAKAQNYIPLTSIPLANATATVSTASTTAVNPDPTMFPPWTWDSSKHKKIDTALFLVALKGGGGSANACLSLWNKTSNTIIGAEKCTTSTSETITSTAITPSTLVNGSVIEARLRTSNAAYPAQAYKAGLLLKLINIQNSTNVQVAAQSNSGLTTTTTYFPESRFKDFGNDFGAGYVEQKFKCSAKKITNGSGTFTLFDHGTATTGTTGLSAIASSDLNFTTEATPTLKASPVLSITENNSYLVGYSASSGAFALTQCLYLQEVTY